MKPNVPKELELIIDTNLSLIDLNEESIKSIKELRIGTHTNQGVPCIDISPNNYLGRLGFKYSPQNAPSIKRCYLDEIGVTFFDIGNYYIFIHSSTKSWPCELEYQKTPFSEYNQMVGYKRAEKNHISK
jgi:hypothetical protein